jgi:tetratricopeptide (TPR) repeat protein
MAKKLLVELGLEKEELEEDEAAFNTSFEDALILEKFELAQKQLTEFKDRYGESASYLFRLGRLRAKQGKFKEAFELFQKLYYELPVFMRDRSEYYEIYRDVIKPKLEKAKAQWNQIVAKATKFLEDNPQKLPRILDEEDEVDPYQASFWEKHYREIDDVAQIYLQVLNVDGYEQAAILGLIQCYSELNKRDQERHYKTILSEAKIHEKGLIKRRSSAALAAASKQCENLHFEASISIVNLGLETDPTNIELLLLKADNLQRLRKFQEALQCVLVALKVNSSNTKALRLKKSIEAQKFELNLRQGLDALFQAEQHEPGSQKQLVHVEKALSRFLDALSYDPQNLTALAGVYRCNIRSGNPLKAQKALDRIREIDSSFDVYSIFRDKKKKNEDDEPCFVATRIFGQNDAHTVCLRKFRNNHLKRYGAGRVFISLYRRIGPSMARQLSEQGVLLPSIRKTLEFFLAPFI